jgi:hypothetical protein
MGGWRALASIKGFDGNTNYVRRVFIKMQSMVNKRHVHQDYYSCFAQQVMLQML